MEKRILVIGASGLLGEPVAIHLKQNGLLVRILARDVEKAAQKYGNEFEIAEGDIKKPGVYAPEGCIPVEDFLMQFLEMEGFGDVWLTFTQRMGGL